MAKAMAADADVDQHRLNVLRAIERLAVEQGAGMAEPAMGDLLQHAALELHPTEMPQGTTLGVLAVARDKRGIEIGRPGSIPAEALTLPLTAFKPVMHVAKHHQRQRTTAANAIDRQG